ncbi:hypothetical protein FRC04_006321 [Tulasnella sp. 424]|nr:hypothetical protein FRC04_006321 [Tulasnella sp. 424]
MVKATKPCDVEQFYDHHPTTATLSLLLGGQLLGPRGIRSLKMSIKPLYRYITGKELAELIKSGKEPLKDYVVVDVRDHDFEGGNIVSCMRSPSEKFDEDLDGLVEKTKDVPRVIFHCTLSQQRGPKAALVRRGLSTFQETYERITNYAKPYQTYAKRRQAEKVAATDPDAAQPEQPQDEQEILVLRGGFAEFQSAFKNDPLLVEKWRKEVWGSGYF